MRLPLLLCISLSCALSPIMALPAAAAESWVPAVEKLQIQRRFTDAEAMLQGLLKRDPDDLAANLQMAMLKRDLLEPKAALTYLKRAASAHPEAFEAQVMLIHGYLWTEEDQDALREAQRVVGAWEKKQTDPIWRAMMYTGLAGAQGLRAERGGLVAAMQHGLAVRGSLEKALSLDPNCVIANYAIGRYFIQAPGIVGGDPARGLSHLEKAIRLDPQDHQIQAVLIRTLLSSNRKADARERYARYRETFEGHGPAMRALADLADKL